MGSVLDLRTIPVPPVAWTRSLGSGTVAERQSGRVACWPLPFSESEIKAKRTGEGGLDGSMPLLVYQRNMNRPLAQLGIVEGRDRVDGAVREALGRMQFISSKHPKHLLHR